MGAFDDYVAGKKPASQGAFDKYVAELDNTSPLDYVKSVASGALSGTGMIFQGGGELLARGVNAVAGTELRAINPLKPAIDWLEESKTPGAKQAEANTQLGGSLFDPSTWSGGIDPSVKGLALQGLNAIGQFAPNLAIAIATLGTSVPAQLTIGATVGGLQALGGGAEEERNKFQAMKPEELQASSELYRKLIERGLDHETAKNAVAETAALGGGIGNAIPSAGESMFEQFLIGAMFGRFKVPASVARMIPKSVVGKAVGGAVGGALMGGTEEAGEQIAQNLGANVAVGGNRPLTADTLQQFVMGAIAEGVAGAGGAVVSHAVNQKTVEGGAQVINAQPGVPLLSAPQPIPAGAPVEAAPAATAESPVYAERNADEARRAFFTSVHQAGVAADKVQETLEAPTLDAAIEAAREASSSVSVSEGVRDEMRFAQNGRMVLEAMERQLEEEKAYAQREEEARARDAELAQLNDEDRVRTHRSVLADMVARGQGSGPIAQKLRESLGVENDNAGTVRSDQAGGTQGGQTGEGGGAGGSSDVQQAPLAGVNPNGTELREAGGADRQAPSVRIPATAEQAKEFTDHALDLARNLTRSEPTRQLIDAEIARRKTEITTPGTTTPPAASTTGAPGVVTEAAPAAVSTAAPAAVAAVPSFSQSPQSPSPTIFGKPLDQLNRSQLVLVAARGRTPEIRAAAQAVVERLTPKPPLGPAPRITDVPKKESPPSFARTVASGAVRGALGKISEKLSVPVQIFDDAKAASAATGTSIPSDAAGFTHNGRIGIVASNINDAHHAEQTLFHEAWHTGLYRKFGRWSKAFETALTKVALANPEVQARAKAWREAYGADYAERLKKAGAQPSEIDRLVRLQSWDEAVAEMSGNRGANPVRFINELIAAFQRLLREMGFTRLADLMEGKSNAEVLSLIKAVREEVTQKPTEHAPPELAPAFAREGETGFKAIVRQLIKGERDKRLAVLVSDKANAVMRALGMGEHPVAIPGHTPDKMIFDHGLSEAQVSRLPELLESPVMVFESETQPGDYVFVTTDFVQKMPLVITVRPDGQMGRELSHIVTSGYPRAKAREAFTRWLKGGLLRYVDQAKRPEWQRSGGLQLPVEMLTRGAGRSILTQADLVKPAAGGSSPTSKEAQVPSFSRAHMGTLTPGQAAALRNIHGDPQTWRTKLAEFKVNWKKNLVQGLFDQFAPIMQYSPQAYRLARSAKGGDSTLEALLLYGKVYVDKDGAYKVDYTRKGGMNGFAKVIAALHGEHDRFLEWVAAHRAERLKSVGLENLYSDADIAALKTLSQGNMKDGGARAAAYAKALKDLNEFNDSVLKIAVDSGLINEATRLMYKDMPYVPFYRLQDEGVAGFGVKAGLVNQSAWKKLKGSTAKLNEDLLANLLQNWSHMITASAKNRAAKATLEAAMRARVAEEVPSSMPGKGLVHFMDAGKERVFRVTDSHLMEAVAAMHYAGLGPIAKPFIAMKRYLTIGVTVNPAFKIRNLIRDSIQAIGTADLSYNPVKNIKQGFKATALESETRAQLLAGGGMIRFGSMLDGNNADRTRRLIEQGVDPALILDDSGKLKRFWKERVLPAFEAYQELGDRGEQISRAALYEQLVAKGMSHEEATFWARDLLDFSLSGKWGAVRVLTQIVPFANARLQGMYKLGRATKSDYKRMGTTLAGVALASLALLLAYGDDDDWKKREDWDRDNYWWFKVGGVAFRVPKPFEIGAVGTLAERSLEFMISKEMTGKRFRERISSTVFNQLNMNPTPQLVKPLMDLYANKDAFTGRPIETQGMENLRKQDRMTERTSEVAKFLGALGLPDPTQLAMGQWNTLSPVQIDSLVRGYFSWLGTSTTTALDWGIRPMVDRGQRPDMKLRDVFLAGNFMETLPSNSSRYVTQMYDQAKEIEEAYGSYKDAIKRGDTEKASQVLAAEHDKIQRYKSVEMLKRRESNLNAQARRIEASKEIPGDEKRRRLDVIEQHKSDLARLLAQ